MTWTAVARGLWALTGLAALAWIGYEDRGLAAVIALSWATCVSGLLTARGRRAVDWRWWLIAGGAAGAAAAPLAGVLILVKTGLHAHPIPDFSAADIARLLCSIPGWALAGIALGGGAALLERSTVR